MDFGSWIDIGSDGHWVLDGHWVVDGHLVLDRHWLIQTFGQMDIGSCWEIRCWMDFRSCMDLWSYGHWVIHTLVNIDIGSWMENGKIWRSKYLSVRVASRYFFLESILMEAFSCTDTSKVPTNPSNCTDIHPKLLINIIFESKMVN